MRYATLVLLLSILCRPAPCADAASDWPQFRGPTGQGLSPDKAVPVSWTDKENMLWKANLPGPGASTPIVVGKYIFVTSYSGFNEPGNAGAMERLKLHVTCLNRADGTPVWTKEIEPKLPEMEKIREEHGYATSSPASDGEQLYTFFGKSGVVAFDFEGNQKWRADVGSKLHGWGSGASLMLYEDLVIVNAGVESESIVALDKKTGDKKWRSEGMKETWSTPVLAPAPDGKLELVFAIMGKVIGLDPKTGDNLWSCATDIGWYMVPSVVVGDGVVFCVGGRTGGGLAVRTGGRGDVTKTHREWKMLKGSNVTSPVYHDGHLYWMHENKGIAYCADAKSGAIVYEQPIPGAGQVYASPVLADGKLYYVNRAAVCYVVAAKPKYELLATNKLGLRVTFDASPAIAGNRLYLRANKTLYCIGKAGE